MNNDMGKPMPILLIEDDIMEHRKFRDCADDRADVSLIGMTGSSDEGLQIVKKKLPEGVILDLELSKGKGHGLQFLINLRETRLALRPIVVVTTNIQSEVMYDRIHDMGVTFAFSKKQAGYNPEMVFDMLLNLRESLPYAQIEDIRPEIIESPEERRVRLLGHIDAELNELGISVRLKGRDYIREAILLLAERGKKETASVIPLLAVQFRVNYNSVIRGIQTVIERAWASSDIETLKEKCPVHIDINTGIPAPTEFIYYYAEKIRKIF